ncbi:Leader peptidase (Prepilin peptidase) / N-methyltransferase [hydrothermal vent metagenome]|uniref:Leader peptidase (Prepilin peptidase) / N-methyltransferase n=1 Tax=hydrothermal vent metagenome TaxID=652676 RepID=A0A3B0VJP8_9ZZZZ
MSETINYVIVFVIGACIGSFLNVCIYRIPAGLSVVRPGSRCPGCGSPVRGYDNIPVFSYFILGGKCRSCKAAFSVRYAMVELFVALLGVALYLRFAFAPEFFAYAAFTAALVTVAFIDLDHKIIPNVISLPGIVAGFAVACLFGFVLSAGAADVLYPSVIDSAIGLVLGGGFLFLISFGYYMLTGRDGLGFGDVKLLAMIGAFVGWKGVLFTIFTGSVAGAVVGVFIVLFSGKSAKYAVPFGPFLSLGALLYIFFGRSIISWYLSLLMVGAN